MKDLFPGYYRPSDSELAKTWQTCTFVLDASVLLNLYRYPKQAREDLFKVLEQISDRLWVPHQVALEYQRNRLDVVAEQVRRFDDVRELVNSSRRDLRNGLEQLQLKRRHSSIDPERLLTRIDETAVEFLKELEELQAEQPDVFSEDKLRSRVDALLSTRVGAPPTSQKDLDAIYQEGKLRCEDRRPPGYGDISKAKRSERDSGVFIHNGMVFRKEYGDLILWFQTIEEAKKRSWKQVILITGDEKEDWWWVSESKGKKTIGPRPELVEEMLSKAGVTTFHMYNSERFLEFARSYLKAQVQPTSIEQVREVTEAQRELREIDRRLARVKFAQINSAQAVLDWLRKTYPPDNTVFNDAGFPDFVRASSNDAKRTGYEVRYFAAIPGRMLPFDILLDVANMGVTEMIRRRISSLVIVVVLDDDNNAISEADRRLRNPKFEVPDNVSFLVGKLVRHDDGGQYEFTPLFESR